MVNNLIHKSNDKISVIIPLYSDPKGKNAKLFISDFKKYEALNYKNFEVLIVCDQNFELVTHLNVHILNTGKKRTGPAEKRDFALKHVKGKYCAFIDDDAYPSGNWLRNAMVDFQDSRVAAVGGPGVTPPEDSYRQQLTGLVYDSYFCGGGARHRFRPEKMRFVEDYPAYNLIVRTDILKKVGGYGSYFYGGEDTFLCLKIIKSGFMILYDPAVLVYHHRRPLFISYIKQISNIGIHRGYFFKKYPETSRLVFYLLPTFLTSGLATGLILSVLAPNLFSAPFLLMLITFWLMGSASIKINNADYKSSLIGGIGIIVTHITYGTFFVVGLLSKKLTK